MLGIVRKGRCDVQDLHGVSKGVEIISKSLTSFKGYKHSSINCKIGWHREAQPKPGPHWWAAFDIFSSHFHS